MRSPAFHTSEIPFILYNFLIRERIVADTVVFVYLQLQTNHFGISFPSTRQKSLRDFTSTGEAIAHLYSLYVWDGTSVCLRSLFALYIRH